MALLLADDATGRLRADSRRSGFDATLPRLGPCVGDRRAARGGHASALDDPTASRGCSLRTKSTSWREPGSTISSRACRRRERSPCSRSDGRSSGEPLNSEDLALLAAVAGQVATALENGRLYRQLTRQGRRARAPARVQREHRRIARRRAGRGRISTIASCAGTARSSSSTASAAYEAVGRRLGRAVRPTRSSRRCARRGATAPTGATLYPRATQGASGASRAGSCSSTSPRCRLPTVGGAAALSDQRDDRSSSRTSPRACELEEQLQISDKMASIGLLAAGVAHEVNTPLTGISSFTQMLLDGADPRGSADAGAREDRAADVPRRQDRQRPAESLAAVGRRNRRAGPVDLNAVINDVLSLLEHQLEVAQDQGAARAVASPAPIVSGIEHKLQQVFLNLFLNARDAMPKGGWLSMTTRASTATRRSSRSPTPARASRASTCRASTIRSSRRRRSARAPVSACRLPTASCASTTERSTATARSARARGSL